MQLFNCKAFKIGNFRVSCLSSFILVSLIVSNDGKTNSDMVEILKARGIIKSDRVSRTMMAIDRKHYCPNCKAPYEDQSEDVGYGAAISPPHLHATVLELIKDYLQPGENALDIGSGTGYLTVCMAVLLGEGGYAVGIDHIPELVDQATDNVKKHQPWLLKTRRIKFVTGDGRKGYIKQAPYKAIYIGASVQELPRVVLEQLKPGGRLVAAVGSGLDQFITVFDKTRDGEIKTHRLSGIRHVPPLMDKDEQLRIQ